MCFATETSFLFNHRKGKHKGKHMPFEFGTLTLQGLAQLSSCADSEPMLIQYLFLEPTITTTNPKFPFLRYGASP